MKHCPIKALAAEFPIQKCNPIEMNIEKEIDESLIFARQAAFPRKEYN